MEAVASYWDSRSRTEPTVDRLFHELITAGAAPQQAPYNAFWGARFAVVADPEGNAVALTSQLDPAYRSTPPAPPASVIASR